MHIFQRRFFAQPSLLDIVTKLRNETSMSIQMCRKAALEARFDYGTALEMLNKANLAAVQPSSQTKLAFGKDGLVGIYGSSEKKFLIELRCDSDFVAKNSDFVLTAENVLKMLLQDKFDNSIAFSSSVQILIENCRSKFKENIGIESVKTLELESDSGLQVIGEFIHQKHSPLTGKIGSLVKLKSSSSLIDREALSVLGTKIAKQVVALSDRNIDRDKLLKSEYMFSDIGTVKNFIAFHEEALKTDITLDGMEFAKIK